LEAGVKRTRIPRFQVQDYKNLCLTGIGTFEQKPFAAGLLALESLALSRGETVVITDLKDKRSGPVVSLSVMYRGREIEDAQSYEEVFEKSVALSRLWSAKTPEWDGEVVIALDLEGTLISNGISQFARPNLSKFLNELIACVDEIVIYSTLATSKILKVFERLESENEVPSWLSQCRIIEWCGGCKSLSRVTENRNVLVFLIDDFEGYVCPEDRYGWFEVPSFTSPYDERPGVLAEVLQEVQAVLTAVRQV
jgi:hypothetical protein